MATKKRTSRTRLREPTADEAQAAMVVRQKDAWRKRRTGRPAPVPQPYRHEAPDEQVTAEERKAARAERDAIERARIYAPVTDKGRGMRLTTTQALDRAILTWLGFGLGSTTRRVDFDEPEATAILNRLHDAVAAVLSFDEANPNAGTVTEYLVKWRSELVEGSRGLPRKYRHTLWPIPRVSLRGDLARIIEYWDGLATDGASPRLSDRALAEVALRSGYRPATVDFKAHPTLADIIRKVAKSVREIRRGKTGQ